MSSSTTKTTVLNQPSHQEPWLFVIKTIAKGGDAWKYLNLELDIEPIVPNRPKILTTIDVNLEKTSILTLSTQEKESYKLLLVIYKEELANTKQILDTIQTIWNYIVTIVSSCNIVYINKKTIVYQMLVALKKRLALTNYTRKLDLARKYNKLKTYSKREDMEKQLKDWETTFTNRKKLSILEVVDKRSLFDFTHAISIIDSGYVSTQEYFLTQKVKTREPLLELYDLVEDFRNHYWRSEALKPSYSYSGFATLNREPQKYKRFCLYKDKHNNSNSWDKCEYITLKNRLIGQKGKLEIFNRINRILKTWEEGRIKWFVNKFKYNRLKETTTTYTQEQKSNTTKNSNIQKPRSFSTYLSFLTNQDSNYKLYNSWTLDNTLDIYVCNNILRSGF